MVFVFFCLAEAVKFFVFTLYLVRLNITVPIHCSIFSDSSPNCLWGFHMERSWNWFHHFTHIPPQKTINVYGCLKWFWGCVYGFWGGRVYGFLGGAFVVFGGAFMVLGEAFMVFGGAVMVLGGAFMVLR